MFCTAPVQEWERDLKMRLALLQEGAGSTREGCLCCSLLESHGIVVNT